MKTIAFAAAAVALVASLSAASAAPRDPASALVPADVATRVEVSSPVVVEGRQAAVAVTAAEALIIDRNVARH